MKKWSTFLFVPLVLIQLLMFPLFGSSQISLTNLSPSASENFNTIGTTGTATLPTNWKASKNTTARTVDAFSAAGTATEQAGSANISSSATNGIYNFGSTTTTSDRAIGGISSSTASKSVNVYTSLKNNGTAAFSKFAISYDVEKYRDGTNAAGYTIQMYYSTDGITWVSAGTNFATSFVADAAVVGYASAPGTTVNVNNTLTLSVAAGSTIYLAWNYSVTSTTTTSNAQALGIDNFAVTATTPISSDATLSGLALSAGSLSPAFTAGNLSYTAAVANSMDSIKVTPTHTDANSTITVNGIATTSGSPSARINLSEGDNTINIVVTAQDGTTTKTYQIVVTRAAAGVATLTASKLASFGSVCINTTGGPNSFTIDASGLDGSNIAINALPGFTYSETPTGTYTNTLSLAYSGTSVSARPVYVKFAPTAVQAYDGNIVISGSNFTSYNVADTGSGVNSAATVTATAATNLKATTTTVGGSISGLGCSTITDYGIKYNPTSSFDPTLAGTSVSATNLSGGNFSVNLTGLDANKQYFYYAYTTSGGVTTYSAAALSFITLPLPVSMANQTDLSFTETFADIANWSNFFITGIGANHWDGLSASATSTGIPNPTILTASTNSFGTGTSATPSASGGVHRGTDQTIPTQSIVLLATGPTDNTSSAAIDLYLDFTGVNAGTLSFDWATINNSTGNRNGSLKIYYSTNSTTFTELANASVLNFTNNIPSSGSKTNIALPSDFNLSPTAILRFYYYNATGGVLSGSETSISGSRPKIKLDNINVTAVATTPCTNPTAPATNLTFGTVTDVSIAGSFTAANPATDSYLIVASTNNSLTSNPINAHTYNVGDNVGDGTVVSKGSATSFTATGLSASTQYNFFVFSMNSICTGGPLYYTTSILIGQATTNAGLPTCAAPAAQPTNFVAGTKGVNSLQGSFSVATADEYLVLISTSSTFTGTINNGQLYSPGDIIGNAKVVQRSNTTSFTAAGLTAGTDYYFYIFSSNTQACVNGPAYNTASPLMSGVQTTNPLPPCSIPTAQPTQFTFNTSNTAISGAFTPSASADDYLVVMSSSAAINATPTNNTDYNVGDNFGSGIVVANSAASSFVKTGLSGGTQYYFYVFAANKNCSGGTKYATAAPLTNNATTTNLLANNYYFGNIHSHSDYSDGNKDHPTYTPADDYNYAKTAQCLDFLGISEHNHFSSANNPGNTIGNYHLGPTQADNFTAANPGFLAMYGMEWGVISGGGHVVVYGDGMNQLFGWESGSGVWGSSNNYDVFVPKSTYLGTSGLFKTVNDYVGMNTFATLAHPNFTDYDSVAYKPYDAVADSAITGSAIESGPATSTNQTYSNPAGISASYLSYFQTLLAKGYHLGPTIDHDNHNTTFGHTTYSRTAVVAPALTKTEVVKAYRNMHFYATQDCDSKVDFSINTKQMGSLVTDRYAPNIAVTLTDATTNTAGAIIRIMYGVPGSGILAAKIDSVIGSSLTYTDNNLANLATGYYYADITNGTARIITSPIWYTRNDAASTVVLPVTLGSFTAQKVSTSVKLNWTTAQEVNSSVFVIERSADGNIFTAIGNQSAARNSTKPTDYTYYDNSPLNGINYYRLKAVDVDGKFTYSDIRSVLFSNRFQLSVSPNPAHDYINLYVSNATNEPYHLQLTDNNGKLLKQIDSNEQHLLINTSTYAKGLYYIKYVDNNEVTTKKIIIE